ncbi:MAG: malate/lactate/ureidoglycolate dehydrogenase [Pirellulales bacterium]|nr:malate/lactate/ureidoglycolate dehydrogenase [Pirellulales bacterium]
MLIAAPALERLVASIFYKAGCHETEANQIARYLVEANLVGHDSHGVIRVAPYIDWLRDGRVVANQSIEVVLDAETFAVVDGRFGFGQVVGEATMRLGLEKARRHGVAVIALKNAGHLGRIGDWPLLLAREGMISLYFVNTNGGGILVAPFGGIERRLSANPIAAGVPVDGGSPILLDISTCAIAEGKIKVALNKGVRVPAGAIIDAAGQPTDDPQVFYANPPGAILPFGGHKGYGLGILVEILAGALTGGGCSRTGERRVANGMLSIILDPAQLQPGDEFAAEVRRYIDFVKSSRTAVPGGEILLPGELEERTRAARLAHGIELDDNTWGQITGAARTVGLTPREIEAAIADG